jgi:hypothetical protein
MHVDGGVDDESRIASNRTKDMTEHTALSMVKEEAA